MLDRYALHQLQNLSTRFTLADGVPVGVKQNYNISPTTIAPVVVSRDGKNVIEKKIWGFVTQGAKDLNGVFRYKTYNARSEKVFDKVMWRKSVQTQRCIVPVDGYYEIRKTKDGKKPYYLKHHKSELLGLAGIYGSWTDPDGAEHGTFTILTTDNETDDGHVIRQPVMLLPAKEAEWLNPENQDINTFYGSVDVDAGQHMTRFEVSQAVISAKAKGAALISPLHSL